LDSRIGGDPRPQERVVSKDSGEVDLEDVECATYAVGVGEWEGVG
jgi:hypothetical protein